MDTNEQQLRDFSQLLFETISAIIKEIDYEIEKVEMKEVTKANLGKVEGITASFADSGNTSPTIYPAAFFEEFKNGTSLEELAEKAVELLKSGHSNMPSFDLESISADNAPDHLFLVLVNKEMNPDIALKCPYIEVEDLIAVPRWRVFQSGDESASILVTHEIQTQMLQMTDEEVCNIAKAATIEKGFTVKGMTEVMIEMMGQDFPEDILAEMLPSEEMMYVVTNEQKLNGATALLDNNTLNAIKDRIGEDTFFVIPSSVHEVLVVPSSKVSDPADLKEMCESVNETEVSLQDKLGDNIYHYNGKKLQICNSIDDLQRQKETTEIAVTEGTHIGRRM